MLIEPNAKFSANFPAEDGAMGQAAAPLLTVVVITRDEARHIAACLRSVLNSVANLDAVRVLVVDSDSADETREIAAAFPVDVVRYRAGVRTAAAGRRIGTVLSRSPFVLFVDGDCMLDSDWLAVGLQRLRDDPGLAAVYGRRREVYEGKPPGFESAASPAETGLGGNALYRRGALIAAGGFHPYLPAEEEGELLVRLQAAGWRVESTEELMFTHHTTPKDTIAGQRRRVLRGMTAAPGMVLRVAARDGLLGHHLRRFDRQVVTLAYLAVGGAMAIAVALGAPPLLTTAWLGAGVVAFAGLWWRRRSLRSALYIATEWVLGAAGIAIGGARGVPPASDFTPVIDEIRVAGLPATRMLGGERAAQQVAS